MGAKGKPRKSKDKTAVEVDRPYLRDAARRTLHVLNTYSTPTTGGRKVPDLGAKVVICRTLGEHHNLFAGLMVHLVTTVAGPPRQVNEDVAMWPATKVGNAKGQLPDALLSAVNQALCVAARYEMGDVIPAEAIASLESAVAILEDLAPAEDKKQVDRLSALSVAEREVYTQWKAYVDQFGMQKDRQVYGVIKENSTTDRSWDAWSRQLRAARKMLDEQKNRPRRSRSATRSVVSSDDLDPGDSRRLKADLGG